jgi:hypothetical protein
VSDKENASGLGTPEALDNEYQRLSTAESIEPASTEKPAKLSKDLAIYKLIYSKSAGEEAQEYQKTELLRVLNPLWELLGDVLFIPEFFQEKGPRLRGWNTLTFDTLPDYWFKALGDSINEGGNLGVLLGPPSGGVCAVDIDYAAAVEPFLADNPRLRKTLTSTGSGIGAQFWVRMTGDYIPKVRKLTVTETIAKKFGIKQNSYTQTYDVGEWRGAQKSTIWGVHANGEPYKILTRVPVIELSDMNELRLPRGWDLRPLRPTEFGQVDDEPADPNNLPNETARRRENKKWRGGGGSHE